MWSYAGSKFQLSSPSGDELPSSGFTAGAETYERPPASAAQLTVKVDAESDRLQLLTPFDKWDGQDITNMTILIKVRPRILHGLIWHAHWLNGSRTVIVLVLIIIICGHSTH